MAIMPIVVNVAENPESSIKKYTVVFRMKNMETDLFVGACKEVQADTKNEMKDLIRPKLQAFLEAQARREQLLAVANAALDELIAELGF
jgi:predicted ATP-dependent protease